MPIYEYKCDKCGRPLEVIERAKTAKSQIDCHCGGTLKRVFSPFNVKKDPKTRNPKDYLDIKGKIPDHDTSIMDTLKLAEKELRETKLCGN
jgi:putative FmdB family regulatory protein